MEEPAERVIAHTPTPIDVGVSTTIELPKVMKNLDYFWIFEFNLHYWISSFSSGSNTKNYTTSWSNSSYPYFRGKSKLGFYFQSFTSSFDNYDY